MEKEGLIPVCPEVFGGLTTPRTPNEIVGGDGDDVIDGEAKVITKDGEDVTEEFIKGARRALEIARIFNIKKAILKQRSPSCGNGKIYDGTFSGNLIEGDGVTAALFKRNGIEVISEEDL